MGDVVRFVKRRHSRASHFTGLATDLGQGVPAGQLSENQVIVFSRRRTWMSAPFTIAPSFFESPSDRELTVDKLSPDAAAYDRATVSSWSIPDMRAISVNLPHLSTAILNGATDSVAKHYPAMDGRQLLSRIELRLKALKMSANKAETLAGAPSAIRNLKRGLSVPKDETINKLAKVLLCPPGWLRGETGGASAPEEPADAGAAQTLLRARAALLAEMEAIQRRVDALDYSLSLLEPEQQKRDNRKK